LLTVKDQLDMIVGGKAVKRVPGAAGDQMADHSEGKLISVCS